MAKKNRIVVTGLSLLEDAVGGDGCSVCDYDVSWVFRYPSTLIWADEILVSPSTNRLVLQGISPGKTNESWGQISRVFFEVADRLSLLKIVDPQEVLTQEIFDSICKQVTDDRKELLKRFPGITQDQSDKKIPGGFLLNGQHYCNPRVDALYFSLFLARKLDARLLLNAHSENYLQHRYSLGEEREPSAQGVLDVFSSVFAHSLPEINMLPPEAYKDCLECYRLPACSVDTVKKIERQLEAYARCRDYDEIHQMKEVFNTIAQEVHQGVAPPEIAKKYEETRRSLERKIRVVFPKAERWSHLATVISLPVLVAGATTGEHLVTGIGAAMAAIPKAVEKYIDYAKSKYRWVGFKQTDV